jgi:hypothetical protein
VARKTASFRLEPVYLNMLDRLVEKGINSNRTEELKLCIIAMYAREFGEGAVMKDFDQRTGEYIKK